MAFDEQFFGNERKINDGPISPLEATHNCTLDVDTDQRSDCMKTTRYNQSNDKLADAQPNGDSIFDQLCNVENLTEEELLLRMHEIAATLKALEYYDRGEGLKLVECIADTLQNHLSIKHKIGHVLNQHQFAEVAMQMLTSIDKKGVFKTEGNLLTVLHTLSALWNFSDASLYLAKTIAEHGGVKYLTVNCKPKPYIDNMSSTDVSLVVKSSMCILYNISRNSDVQHYFKENSTSDVIIQFLQTQKNDELLTITALLTLGHIVEEEENDRLIEDTGAVEGIVRYIKLAPQNERGRYKGFTQIELIDGLCKLAVNDKNKSKNMAASTTDGTSSKDLSHLPEILFAFVEEFVEEKNRQRSRKEQMTKGFKYHSEKYVHSVSEPVYRKKGVGLLARVSAMEDECFQVFLELQDNFPDHSGYVYEHMFKLSKQSALYLLKAIKNCKIKFVDLKSEAKKLPDSGDNDQSFVPRIRAKKIIDAGALPLLLRMLKQENIEEQAVASKALCTLSFDKDVAQKIRDFEDLMPTLDKLSGSQDRNVEKNCKGALFVLKGENDVNNHLLPLFNLKVALVKSTKTRFEITWDKPIFPSKKLIEMYKLIVNGKERDQFEPGIECNFTWTPEPDDDYDEYTFAVIAYCVNGTESKSDEVTCTMLKPPVPPRNIRFENHNGIKLMWDHPHTPKVECIKHYTIYIKDDGRQPLEPVIVQSTKKSQVIQNLKPKHRYTFEVSTCSIENFEGLASVSIESYTGDPLPPKDIKVYHRADGIELVWLKPEFPVEQYIKKYGVLMSSDDNPHSVFETEDTRFFFERKVKPNTVYEFQCKTYTTNGHESQPSEKVSLDTTVGPH